MTATPFRILAFVGLTLAVVLGCSAPKEPEPQPKLAEPEAVRQPKPGGPEPTPPPPEIVEEGSLRFFCRAAVADFQGVHPGETVVIFAECKGLEKGGAAFQLSKRYYGSRPAIPATTLAADYAKDETAAKRKYEGRVFAVRGVFLGAKDMDVRISRVRTPGEVTRGTDPQIALIKGVLGRQVEIVTTAKVVAAEQKTPEANSKYIGKMVEVSGVVLRITGSPFSDILYIDTGTGDTKIECSMLSREPWNEIAYGQQVTVRGHCRGVGSTFFLHDCAITEHGPSPAQSMTATDLAQEYAADSAKTNDKYHAKTKDDKGSGTTLLVTGEVVAWTDKSNRFFFQPLVLKGADGVRVVCTLGTMLYPEFEAPVGTKVQVIGCYRRSEEKDVVIISGCFLRYTK